MSEDMKPMAPVPGEGGYDGCDCATCKELNVNCDNCPECGPENESEEPLEATEVPPVIDKPVTTAKSDVDKFIDPFAALLKRDYSVKERQRMADAGDAMPDGSFPIANQNDLQNAIQSVGRAKNYDAAKKHIMQRAKEMGLTRLLPEDWRNEAKKGDTGWGGSIFDITPFKKY